MSVTMEAADLVLLADSEDPLAYVLDRSARRRGLIPAWLNLREFAMQAEVQVSNGAATVSPAKPLLVRPITGFNEPDEDMRFHLGERFAAAWSYAALNPRPVLNRPNEWGWSARGSSSGALTEYRCYGSAAAEEVFWHGKRPALAERVLHQELQSWRRVEAPEGEQCVRSRAIPDCLGWDQVIVVGAQGFRVTEVDIGPHELEKQSVLAAAALGLTFATVSWGIRRDHLPPILARINAFPSYLDIEPVGAAVIDSLIDRLVES